MIISTKRILAIKVSFHTGTIKYMLNAWLVWLNWNSQAKSRIGSNQQIKREMESRRSPDQTNGFLVTISFISLNIFTSSCKKKKKLWSYKCHYFAPMAISQRRTSTIVETDMCKAGLHDFVLACDCCLQHFDDVS